MLNSVQKIGACLNQKEIAQNNVLNDNGEIAKPADFVAVGINKIGSAAQGRSSRTRSAWGCNN